MPDVRGAVALSTNYQLDKAKHGSVELHKFGQSLLDPTYVAPVASTTVGAVGLSDEVCRADHIHGLSQITLDSVTGAQSSADSAKATADGIYAQINGYVDFVSNNPLRFNNVPATLGPGTNYFYYTRQGVMVDHVIQWHCLPGASYGTGTLSVVSPIQCNTIYIGQIVGRGLLYDAGSTSQTSWDIQVQAAGVGYTVLVWINPTGVTANNGFPFLWNVDGDIGRGTARFGV